MRTAGTHALSQLPHPQPVHTAPSTHSSIVFAQCRKESCRFGCQCKGDAAATRQQHATGRPNFETNNCQRPAPFIHRPCFFTHLRWRGWLHVHLQQHDLQGCGMYLQLPGSRLPLTQLLLKAEGRQAGGDWEAGLAAQCIDHSSGSSAFSQWVFRPKFVQISKVNDSCQAHVPAAD